MVKKKIFSFDFQHLLLLQAGSNLFLNGIVLGCLWCGGQLMATSQLQPGDLMSFLVAAQTIQKSLAQLGIMFGTYVRGISAGARVFEVRCLTLYFMLRKHTIIAFISSLETEPSFHLFLPLYACHSQYLLKAVVGNIWS